MEVHLISATQGEGEPERSNAIRGEGMPPRVVWMNVSRPSIKASD